MSDTKYPIGKLNVPPPPQKRVAIFGSGIGGLTAAHELAERGYEVHVYEREHVPGGRAHTEYALLSAGSTSVLPAEHGFRLYPSFYHHLTDTMRRIPFDPHDQITFGYVPPLPGQNSTVTPPQPPQPFNRPYRCCCDNLLSTQVAGVARAGKGVRSVPRAGATTPYAFIKLIEDTFTELAPGTTVRDLSRFQLRMLQYLTSSTERRGAYEDMSWWDFIDGPSYPASFQREIVSFIRTMVAMDAKKGSARTVGNIAMQMTLDTTGDGDDVDRVMNGPTSEQLIYPWARYLSSLGVQFHFGHTLLSLVTGGSPKQITRARVRREDPAGPVDYDVTADYYVLAVALSTLQTMLRGGSWGDDLAGVDTGLKWVKDTDISVATAPISGVQYYLRGDVPMIRGHVYYPDAPWGLSSVSQGQFWSPDFVTKYAAGRYATIVSVDVADWEAPGKYTSPGKPALLCQTADEICLEVWRQLQAETTVNGKTPLADENLFGFHLDDEVIPSDRSGTIAPAPVKFKTRHFVHPAGSYDDRPVAGSSLPNLVIAGDFVQTTTDLATMEGANEAGRRAVNAILQRSGYSGAPCELFPLAEPAWLGPYKNLDANLYANGDKHLFEILGFDRIVEHMPDVAWEAIIAAASGVHASHHIANLLGMLPSPPI